MVLLVHRNILTDRDVNGGAETLDYIGQEPFDHTPWLAKLPAVDGLKYWKVLLSGKSFAKKIN